MSAIATLNFLHYSFAMLRGNGMKLWLGLCEEHRENENKFFSSACHSCGAVYALNAAE